ncbi:MAG TPA: type I DNA topoisomerase, partial [Thermodesulfobacteriota bacterium]|nr:type I DNA topoisomerase [Thermodesulfobacteriota bacterium]
MAKSLVIVESPAKVKTIKKFLGKDYEVMACMGHVRGLPSRSGSVEVKNDFEPRYEVLPKSSKHLKQIKKTLPACDRIFLATDLDREGEAIAWHLIEALDLNKKSKRNQLEIKRITFHEITKPALDEALKQPRSISQPLVDAQQARVVMDYLYGFSLSPFLWRKVRSGLSAGRVQSPALRMICERELEIQAFNEEEYWTINAELSSEKTPRPETTFESYLIEISGKKLEKLDIKNEAQAQEIATTLRKAAYQVKSIEKKERKTNPPPPLITSTLQQEASTKLGFSARRTMSVAQELYEGVEISGESEGLITYMRTDSFHLADTAVTSIRDAIVELFGPDYVNKTVRRFKTKSRTAQEAHEAIRPTEITRTPDSVKAFLSPDQFKLYDLIWKRALACQMAQSVEDRVSVDIQAGPDHVLRAVGTTVTFPGFRRVLIVEKDTAVKEETPLPPLSRHQELTLVSLNPQQHFTKPPPRYSEASLVKALEEHGIGRPSTYATIIGVLQDRDYVRLENRRFIPQEIGMVVYKLLTDHFNQYVDYQFTAKIEEDFDDIARGREAWKPVVRKFWEPFSDLLKTKNAEVKKAQVVSEPTGELCPECGKPLVIRLGPYSRFLACTGYPKCRYTKPLNGSDSPEPDEQQVSEVCEQCGKPMIVKRGRYGTFLGCSGYPECKNTKRL